MDSKCIDILDAALGKEKVKQILGKKAPDGMRSFAFPEDGGWTAVYKELLKNGTDAPDVYLVDTWDGNIPGPPVLLFDWTFGEQSRIYTVHLASDGRLDPPLPRTLANFVAMAIKK